MLCMATGKPAHLGCKFLLDVSVVNSPIVVELLVITVLFCVVLPAGSTTQNSPAISLQSATPVRNCISALILFWCNKFTTVRSDPLPRDKMPLYLRNRLTGMKIILLITRCG